MIETMITLGNRKYRVAYEEGQERELAEAVNVFNFEVESIQKDNDQVRENQLLMMSGLMLAYKFSGQDGEKSKHVERLRELENELAQAKVQAKATREPDADMQSLVDRLQRENKALMDARNAADAHAGKLNDQLDELREATQAQPKLALDDTALDALKAEHTKTSDELAAAQAERDSVKAENNSLQEQLTAAKVELEKASNAPAPAQSAEDGLASMLGEIVTGLEGLGKK